MLKKLDFESILKISLILISIGYVFDEKKLINTFFFIGLFIQLLRLIKYRYSFDLNDFKVYYKLIFFMMLFCISITISSFFAVDINLSLKYAEHYFKWMFIPFFMAIILCFRIDNFQKYICYGFVISILIINVGIIYNSLALNFERCGDFFIKAPNATAGTLIFLYPFILFIDWTKNIYVKYSLLVFTIFTVVLTGSRGALAALFCIIFLSLFSKFRKIKLKKIIIFTMISVSFLLISYNYIDSQKFDRFTEVIKYHDSLIEHRVGGDRLLLWKSSLNMIDDYTLFGVGLKNFNKVYIENNYINVLAKEPNLQSPHNMFLHFFVETGIIGGISFIALILYQVDILKKYISKYKDEFSNACFLAIIGMCIHGMVDYLFFFKFFYQLYWFVISATWFNLMLKKYN